MQLIIKKLTGATIESNISELDTYMQETKKRYENWIVIESEIKNAKEERALLNKLEKELSDTRKKVQKEGLASIDNFIDKLKESEKEIKALSENINNQVKAFEEQEIEIKLKEVSEIKNKIDTLSSDISDLQALKKKLTSALDIAKVQVAEIFIANGIDRIDGNIISSLTLSNATSKTKDEIIIKNEDALINLGYVKFSVDLEAVEKALSTKEGKKELKKFVDVTPVTISTPAKIKVNTKRTSANNTQTVETDEILVIEQQMEDEYTNDYKKLVA
jgi:DNA repair exonuclease SbcCD ATPase subunit